MDAANLLKPMLARGELKCIGATTFDEYRQYIEKDAAFKEVEEKLSQSIGTKVLINGSESKGKIEIEYYSRAELDRLIELLED